MQQKNSNRKLLKKVQVVKTFTYPVIYALIVTGLARRNKKLIDRIISFIGIPKSVNNFLQRFEYEDTFRDAFKENDMKNKLAVFPMLQGINGNYTLLNLLLSSKLSELGYKSIFLYCKSELPICNRERIGKTRTTDPFLCHECSTGYSRLASKTGITAKSFSESLTESDKKNLILESDKVNKFTKLEEFINYEYEGLAVGIISKKSVMRFFFSGELKNDERTIAVYRSFLKSGVKTFLTFTSFVKSNPNIGVMFVQNGTLGTEGIIIEICSMHKIKYVTYETWIGNNSIIFKKNGKVMDLSWEDEWNEYLKKELSAQQKEQVSKYVLGLQSGKEVYARLNSQHKNEKIKHLKKYACLFTNLNYDTAVLEKHIAFTGMMQWIKEVIEFWQTNKIDTGLVIRIHPGEIKLRTPSQDFAAEILKPLIHSENVVLLDSIDEVNSYNLIEEMEFGMVYTSTIGLEIAYRGKPILVAGNSFYRNKSFSIAPKTAAEYFDVLKKLISDRIVFKQDINVIEKYIHFIYFNKTKRLNGMKIITRQSEPNSEHDNWQELKEDNREFLNDFVEIIKN